jgi:formylglycine-generating enzyme required for sulfatase activity
MRVARNKSRYLTNLLPGGLLRTLISLTTKGWMNLDRLISGCTATTSLTLFTAFWMCSTAMATVFGTLLLVMIFATNAMASDSKGAYQPLEHFRDCDACSEMLVLPSGKYMMGATEDEFAGNDQYRFMYVDETPRHEADVKSFALAKFDVTRKQFEIFANETGFSGKGCHIFNGKEWVNDANADWRNPGFRQSDSDPVVCVSWDDTQRFIAWLNSKLAKTKARTYRLPTETEWEYAARAGTTTATYWGHNPLDQCKYENTRDQSARVLDATTPIADCTDGYVETSPVGSFRPNPWGLFDMLGDATQWAADCPFFSYSALPRAAPNANSASCRMRAVRGASWATIPIGVRAAFRAATIPNRRDSTNGFRLAADLSN